MKYNLMKKENRWEETFGPPCTFICTRQIVPLWILQWKNVVFKVRIRFSTNNENISDSNDRK